MQKIKMGLTFGIFGILIGAFYGLVLIPVDLISYYFVDGKWEYSLGTTILLSISVLMSIIILPYSDIIDNFLFKKE